MSPRKTALIAGAGPAGLTAAFELVTRTDVKPIVFEASGDIGGISKTVEFRGNRIDIGGHRFFSKSDRVMSWWQSILPVQGAPSRDDLLLGRMPPIDLEAKGPDPEREERVMLVRGRVSRIFFLRHFFDYPVSLNLTTVRGLGLIRIVRILISYFWTRLRPIRPEKSLHDFFINRFGRELYTTFFKDYTEKVWGIPCDRIKPEWGAQRVKGLSITKTLVHALKRLRNVKSSIRQEGTETSLIEQFMYPKYGPGHLWQEVAMRIKEKGGEVLVDRQVIGIGVEGRRVTHFQVRDTSSGRIERIEGDIFFSSMAIKDMAAAMGEAAPPEVRRVASGLVYRDFVSVGLVVKRLLLRNDTPRATVNGIIPDNWIYIQESEVRLGRIQVLNNWSPYMVRDPNTVVLGLEYFCDEGDHIWNKSDSEMVAFATEELARIGFIDPRDVLDSVVARVPKAYPAYFGTYEELGVVREYLDGLTNLFCIGRNGMHRYNNADHSMLTAMLAVDNLVEGIDDRTRIWDVNIEEEYHEEK